jgi:hypothetical protein
MEEEAKRNFAQMKYERLLRSGLWLFANEVKANSAQR